MKDYYYILGLKQEASMEDVKKAYRKLSVKFHPDKNDGDEFFTERFKEIQEAYEILGDSSKRKTYDYQNNKESTDRPSYAGTNFSPLIEYFKSDKLSFEYDEEVTFLWKTINANKVILKPFGLVQPIGQKTYKIKDFKNPNLTFELVAENTNIDRQIKSYLSLTNKTYRDLKIYFKQILREEIKDPLNQTPPSSGEKENKPPSLNENKVLIFFIWVIFLFLIPTILALIIIYLK